MRTDYTMTDYDAHLLDRVRARGHALGYVKHVHIEPDRSSYRPLVLGMPYGANTSANYRLWRVTWWDDVSEIWRGCTYDRHALEWLWRQTDRKTKYLDRIYRYCADIYAPALKCLVGGACHE